jgi:hypothetical protein
MTDAGDGLGTGVGEARTDRPTLASQLRATRKAPTRTVVESGVVPTVEELIESIEAYLLAHAEAAVIEDGRVIFDLRSAKYSIVEAHGRCQLQMWSEERNLVRTVVTVEKRAQALRLLTRKLGVTKPQALELVPTSDRRTPTARDATRRNYLKILERVLTRNFADLTVEGLRSAMDLEHSFGPAYVRGALVRGTTAEAVIAVSEAESAGIVDGVLTLGVLWLEYCRQHSNARRLFGALKVIVPAGAWRVTAERMRWLNHRTARFELYQLDERSEELTRVELEDTGNVDARLVHAFNPEAAQERCREGLDRILKLVPVMARERVEVRAHSATEVGLLLHGLDFARVRHAVSDTSFARVDEVSFGAGAHETPLMESTEGLARTLFARLFASRHADGVHVDALYRLQPERWLEAQFRERLGEILPALRADLIYTQVPALSGGNRGILDLLTLDRDGRLVVLELKADEDLQLPMQALDYWIRVRALNADRKEDEHRAGTGAVSAFERMGYFNGAKVSAANPRIILAAPALRVHPSNETVLRYLSAEVEWELLAVGEHWRRDLTVVFRKRSSAL